MCREYVPGMSTPSYLPDDVVRMTAFGTDIFNNARYLAKYSFWDVISTAMPTEEDFPDAIGDFIFDETEKPELGGFSTRDLFECAMMGFDGHEYKTDLTGLTGGITLD